MSLASWQIPATFFGSFTHVLDGAKIKRDFHAYLVNTNQNNSRFMVTLEVRGALAVYKHEFPAPIVHGSGKSADIVALENAIASWCVLPKDEIEFSIDESDD